MRVDVSFRKTLRIFRTEKHELVAVPDREPFAACDQEIPQIVFQTADSNLVHPSHAKSINEFRDLNPELGFSFFDKESRDKYLDETWGSHPISGVYKRSVLGQMEADIFRYCIVLERGGYYFDFNKGCAVPLTSLHSKSATGLVSYEKNPALLFPDKVVANRIANPFNLLLQWGFGFTAGHPFLRMVIDRIVEIEPFFRDVTFRDPKAALLTMSAPGVFTEVFRRFVKAEGLSGIEEAGVDFNERGIFRLRGSKKTTRHIQYYGYRSNDKIIDSGLE